MLTNFILSLLYFYINYCNSPSLWYVFFKFYLWKTYSRTKRNAFSFFSRFLSEMRYSFATWQVPTYNPARDLPSDTLFLAKVTRVSFRSHKIISPCENARSCVARYGGYYYVAYISISRGATEATCEKSRVPSRMRPAILSRLLRAAPSSIDGWGENSIWDVVILYHISAEMFVLLEINFATLRRRRDYISLGDTQPPLST